jgi:hypothetical protein
MARKERNSVDYFPFLCKEGKVMYYIENKYGNDGYATWIKLLRLLAVTEYHYLCLKSKVEVMFISSKCRVSENILLSIIDDLVQLGEFDLYLWNNYKVIWSQKFIDSIEDAYKKRNNKCVDKNSILILIGAKSNPNEGKSNPNGAKSEGEVSDNPQKKEKDSKLEDIKGEEKQNFNHAAFLEFWNLSFKDKKIPKLNSVTESRKKAIDKLLKIYSKKDLENTIKKIAESDFANGKNKNNWVMTFDFLIKPDNFTKAMEGNYDNTKIKSEPTFVTNR